MYQFPKNLYTDVRIEDIFTTRVAYKKDKLQEIKVRNNKGAFIRVYDGIKWYYTATTDLASIQSRIDEMALMATPLEGIESHPVVMRFEVHEESLLNFENTSVTDISTEEKQEIIYNIAKAIHYDEVVDHESYYLDKKVIKHIYTSKGSAIHFDKQMCGIKVSFDIKIGEKTDSGRYSKAGLVFDDVKGLSNLVHEEIKKSIDFTNQAVNVVPGDYPVLLGPEATGVFTHESFGHKSEADFMVGDENMKKEWALGKTIGQPLLNIIEDGNIPGMGYTPFDDEGTKARKNYIIKDGILTGRLHSSETATILDEAVTGNARAINFEFEPIVRMTTTYIDKGHKPYHEIISEMEKGVFIDTIKHGSGMSTFTIAPARAYMIENGMITTPVKISVVTGSVFETLQEVDAFSEEFELLSFVGGGCGKMEQYPLAVGFGGPYIRVRKLQVQ